MSLAALAYDEEVVSNTDQEQPIFDEYTSDGDEHNFSMFSLEPLSTILYMMIMSLILGNAMEVLKGNYICS
jgi:hypothetical protein